MIRKIEITAVLNGFIVQVGCQTVVFTSIETLTKELKDYLENPDKIEQAYMTNSINARKLKYPVLAEPERLERIALTSRPDSQVKS